MVRISVWEAIQSSQRMPTECNITFENADNVFYGGQLLIGHVELSLTHSEVIQGKQKCDAMERS